jgi:flagellar FliJ protein
MKGIPTLIRMHRWRLEEMRRELGELEGLHADLRRRRENLEQELRAEQQLAASSPEWSYTYSGYATSYMHRRDKLEESIREVEATLVDARERVRDAFQEVKKYELVEERTRRRIEAENARAVQGELDEMGLQMHRAGMRRGVAGAR